MVKRISIWPRAPWLPWGLSLVTGTTLTILSFISYPVILNPMVDLVSSAIPREMRVLEVEEIPVDVVEVSKVPIIDGGRGVQLNAPTLRDALAFLFAPQGGDGKWTKKADMPTARGSLSTSVVNGKIYAIGGSPDGFVAFSTVEEYDPATDKWTKKTDIPIERYWLSTSVVNGKIYAIGGSPDGFVAFSTVEEYDPATDKWATRAGMPTARLLLSTSVVNEKIYAIGGIAPQGVPALSTVEEYDPATDKWTKKAHMPTVRYGLSTSAVNGKIYAIGGTAAQGRPVLSTVEEFDPGFAGEGEEGQGVEAKGKNVTSWGKMKK